MSKAIITPEALNAAYVLDEFDFIVEEEHDCPTCGDEFRPGQQALDVYAHLPGFTRRGVWTIHLACFQGEDIRTT